MFADISGIESLTAHLTGAAAELDAIATALPSVTPSCATALGPVGIPFVHALTATLTQISQQVSRLAGELTRAGDTANATAIAYIEAEDRSVTALGG